MKYVILAVFSVITLFNVSLIAETKPAPSVEIISTNPPCPAVLKPGQKLYVKLRYNAGDAESFQIWVRPKRPAPGYKAHPCKPITKKIGEYEGWFYFNDRATVINEISIEMKGSKSKAYMLRNTYPLKAEWKAPQKKIVKQKEKPKPMDHFAVIQEGIAKKYAKKYEGIWTHTITKPDGRKHAAIIKALRNENGILNFSFLHNPFTSAPISRKNSIDQYRATMQFKLDDSEKAMMYSLVRKNDVLTGDLYLSWQDQPEKITLRKLNLTQAISALEEQYIKNVKLERSRKSFLEDITKLKKQGTKLKADLINSNSETTKLKNSLANAQKTNKKQQQESQKKIKELQTLLSNQKEEKESLTNKLGKYEEAAESGKNKNKQLQNRLMGLEKQITDMSKALSDMNASKCKLTNIVDETQKKNSGLAGEISALKGNIEKLKQLNRTLQRQKKQLQKEFYESKKKRDQENNDDDSRKKRKSSSTRMSQGYWVG